MVAVTIVIEKSADPTAKTRPLGCHATDKTLELVLWTRIVYHH